MCLFIQCVCHGSLSDLSLQGGSRAKPASVHSTVLSSLAPEESHKHLNLHQDWAHHFFWLPLALSLDPLFSMSTKLLKPTGSRRKGEDSWKKMAQNRMCRGTTPQEASAVCDWKLLWLCYQMPVLWSWFYNLLAEECWARYLIALNINSIHCVPVASVSKPAKIHGLWTVNWLLWLHWTSFKMLPIHLKNLNPIFSKYFNYARDSLFLLLS